MNFYISDLHINHENMLFMDPRPFETCEEENEEIIKRWNNAVKENDTVYILGDCFWKSSDENITIMKRLKGKKILIRGNHDKTKGNPLTHLYSGIYDYKEIVDNAFGLNKIVVLSHYPIPFFKQQHRGAIMLYGHVHMTREWDMIQALRKEMETKSIPNELHNVGCMLPYMNYTPRTLEQIITGDRI